MTNVETGRLGELLGRIGADLDGFLVSPRRDPVETMDDWSKTLSGDLPQTGAGADAVVALLGRMIPNGSRMSDPTFWGFITAGPSTTPVVAYTAGMIASPQRYTITAFNRMEELSLDWLASLCGLAPQMKGLYSSGGSTANLVALGAARQWAYEQIGLDVARDGFADRRGAIYSSAEAHHTIGRAAGALGLGRRWVRSIPVDADQRMNCAALRAAIEADVAAGALPVCVVATAGTTNTGAIDPLREIGEIAREFGAWFHVDGAYGLPGILDERVAARYDGLDLADSAIVDPHKWLGAPVGVAATFVRDRAILQRAFTQEPADYLEGSFTDDVAVSIDHLGIDYADFGVELSAPARGVTVWAILVEQGREGIRKRVAVDNDRARRVTRLANEHPRLEALSEPALSIACIRYKAPGVKEVDSFNTALLRRLLRETRFMPSSTLVNGAFAIRPCFINVRTTDEMLDEMIEDIVRIGDAMTSA